MADLLLLLTGTGFLGLCAVYVRVCEHLLGPDPKKPHPDPADHASAAEATTGHPTARKTVTS